MRYLGLPVYIAEDGPRALLRSEVCRSTTSLHLQRHSDVAPHVDFDATARLVVAFQRGRDGGTPCAIIPGDLDGIIWCPRRGQLPPLQVTRVGQTEVSAGRDGGGNRVATGKGVRHGQPFLVGVDLEARSADGVPNRHIRHFLVQVVFWIQAQGAAQGVDALGQLDLVNRDRRFVQV